MSLAQLRFLIAAVCVTLSLGNLMPVRTLRTSQLGSCYGKYIGLCNQCSLSIAGNSKLLTGPVQFKLETYTMTVGNANPLPASFQQLVTLEGTYLAKNKTFTYRVPEVPKGVCAKVIMLCTQDNFHVSC